MDKYLFTIFFSLLTSHILAEVPSRSIVEGVTVSSDKKGSVRTYSGTKEKILSYGLRFVKLAAMDFGNRCNNQFKDKRRFTSKAYDCGFHNENLIESFIEKTISSEPSKNAEAYLLARQIYNRSRYGYYELVTVEESVTQKNLQKIVINLKMLSDSEVRKITAPKFSQESAFNESLGTFVLTELTPDSTNLSYTYSAETDHWLLNKELSVPRVFSSIAQSLNDLFKAIEDEALVKKKEEKAKLEAEK